jgi:hypothetical protein
MTLEETVAVLTPLALALRVDLDVPTFKAYHKQLEKVAVQLVDGALTDLSESGLRFMPTAFEIKNAAEKKRRQLLAAHPYDGCADCDGHLGFRHIIGGNGQPVVEKCPCKARWQQRLAGMGALEPIAFLPGESVNESEQVYPTIDQLPAHLRKQIAAVVGQKVLR